MRAKTDFAKECLRTDGSLGGYAYGLPVKQALLEHEGALTAPEQQQLAL